MRSLDIFHNSLSSSQMTNDKSCSEKNTHFVSSNLLVKSCRLWNNVEKRCTAAWATDDIVTWRMRIACWIPKATNTQSQYVILIALPLQQWLHECLSMLRYSYSTMPVKKHNLNNKSIYPFRKFQNIHLLLRRFPECHFCLIFPSRSHFLDLFFWNSSYSKVRLCVIQFWPDCTHRQTTFSIILGFNLVTMFRYHDAGISVCCG